MRRAAASWDFQNSEGDGGRDGTHPAAGVGGAVPVRCLGPDPAAGNGSGPAAHRHRRERERGPHAPARLRADGGLRSIRHGRTVDYELAGLVETAFRRALGTGHPDRRDDEARAGGWSGYFHGILFTLPEDARSHRDRLRNAARLVGYAPLRPGLMISPWDGWPALGDVVAALPGSATVYPLRLAFALPDARAAAAEAWQLPRVAANTEGLSERLAAALEDDPPSAGPAVLSRYVELALPAYHFFVGIPRLPDELLPSDWPLPRLVSVLSRVRSGSGWPPRRTSDASWPKSPANCVLFRPTLCKTPAMNPVRGTARGAQVDLGASADRATLIRNSVVAFVTGATIMILLHESSHAVAGALLGYRPIQLPFAVSYVPDPTPSAAAATAITGPVFSLVSGLLGVVVDRLARPFRRRPYWRLVWLWTVFASLQEGFGYFLIAGIAPAGDTAQAFTLWGLPTWTFFAATAFGIGGQFLTAWLFATPVSELSASLGDKRAIAVWPWIWGTIVVVVLTMVYVLLSPSIAAGDLFAVLAGAVAIGVYAPMSMMFGRDRCLADASLMLPKHPRGGYVLLGVLIVVNLLLTRAMWWP